MTTTARNIRAGIVLLFFLLALAFISELVSASQKRNWEHAAEEKSIAALANAKSKQELKEAVGDLGAYLLLKDGSWIAIRYRDSHALSIKSSAVALTSDGNWFRSNEHYCGRFEHYRKMKRNREEFLKGVGSEKISKEELDSLFDTGNFKLNEEILAIETSETLGQAEDNLRAIGFEQFYPDS